MFDLSANSIDIAQRTSEFLGVKFNPVHVTEEIIAQRFEDTVWYSEAFAADTNGMGKLAMAEVAHDAGFKVVITGRFPFLYHDSQLSNLATYRRRIRRTLRGLQLLPTRLHARARSSLAQSELHPRETHPCR